MKSLKLFGSVVRGEARPESDIDILVEFSRPIGLLAFVRLKHRLTELLGGSGGPGYPRGPETRAA